MYLVVLSRTGPQWRPSKPLEEQTLWDAHAKYMDELVDSGFIVLGGPLVNDMRTVHVIEADSPEHIRATLANDPWADSHLRIESIEPWTIRLDSRR